MKRSVRAASLFVGFAFLVALAAPQSMWGQEKKDKDKKAKAGPAIEATERTAKEWVIRPAALGLPMLTDKKDYVLTALPKELAGTTYLIRTAGDHGQWLPTAAVKAKQDGTVFAMIRVKYNNKDAFDAAAQAALEKNGWKPVDGKAATTSPGKENWEWKVWKTDVKEGDVSLILENFKWPGTAVLFFFK